ncbi:MAG: hypothetical protein HY690_09720 [Chloroflexi bacterium]|nr:hypothetical protein [Chloroflexota bacterium]
MVPVLLAALLLLGALHPAAGVPSAVALEAESSPPAELVSTPLMALDSYVYPQIGPVPETDPWCLRENPSCGRDPWWAERNEPQDAQLVQYQFVGPGLVTEQRFAEVARLLWQWSEGRFLLGEAAAHHVAIVTLPDSMSSLAYAAYIPQYRVVFVNRRFTAAPTWMVAAVLAHELKHAADHRAGSRQELDFEDCIAREQVAYQVEARYLQWLGARYQGFPSRDLPLERLAPDDLGLYLDLYHVATSPDVNAEAFEDYRQHCAT